MSRPREYTIPYPAHVDTIERMFRYGLRKKTPAQKRELARSILTHEYGARRPRYSLIRFLKAHR